MAKETRTQAKRKILAIQSKAFSLIGRPPAGMTITPFTVKDFEAITKICNRALNRLK